MTSTMPFFATARGASLSSVLAFEADHGISRRVVTVLAGSGAVRALVLGTVLGRRLFGAPVIAAKQGGNTGDGALGTLTRGDACKVGIYTVTCTVAAADGGRFAVIDPDGYRLADALVGVAYVSPQLAFTIADGAADYVVGDGFTITIAKGDGKVVALDAAAHDGTQLADSVLIDAVTAPDGTDAAGRAVTQFAGLIESGLVWPADTSDPAKAAHLARLATKFLSLRQAA